VLAENILRILEAAGKGHGRVPTAHAGGSVPAATDPWASEVSL
jgi:hypothetical protein